MWSCCVCRIIGLQLISNGTGSGEQGGAVVKQGVDVDPDISAGSSVFGYFLRNRIKETKGKEA